jgi:voltage-gated potassium channel
MRTQLPGMARLRSALADPVRQLQVSLLLLMLLVAAGTTGYVALESMSWRNALYMTVITITTVGFGEVQPLAETTRMFTIGLIVAGVGIGAWSLTKAIEVLLGPALWISVRKRRMERIVRSLEGHHIVCGYGRLGRGIARDVESRGEALVVVEQDAALEPALVRSGLPHLIGDATRDEVLRRAGVARARGLVAALDSEAANVLTVLSARELNPELLIVARATSGEAERKLRRAGADRVVAPDEIGAHRLALALLRPAVHDFFERVLSFGDNADVDLGELPVPAGSPWIGRSVAQVARADGRSLSVLALRTAGGAYVLVPAADRPLAEGDALIVVGPAATVHAMERGES